MKLRLFLGGVLLGGGLGMMVGAGIVDVSTDGGRNYPVIISTLLAVAGVGIAATGWRRSGS